MTLATVAQAVPDLPESRPLAASPAGVRSAAADARGRSLTARTRARRLTDTSVILLHGQGQAGAVAPARAEPACADQAPEDHAPEDQAPGDQASGAPASGATRPTLSLLLSGPAPEPLSRRIAALVDEHLSLADSIARSMTPTGQSREDFVQVGRLALVEAARRYDPDRGVPFIGYAHAVIRGYLKHHLRDRVWAVRPPRRLQELWLEVHPARERLAQRLGRAPSVTELSLELGEDPETVHTALSVQNAWAADSIDTAVEARREPAVREAGFELIEDRAWLRPAMQALPDRLQLVLQLRFTQELTQQEIADRIGCSQMHVSRLLAKALSSLRAVAEAE